MKYLSILILCLIGLTSTSSIFDQYYNEARKIAQGMTLEQKIGQMIQADFQTITDKQKPITNVDQAVSLNLGSLLISGNAAPTQDGNLAKLPNMIEQQKYKETLLKSTEANWKKFTDRFNAVGINVTSSDKKKYMIKFLLGTDAVHGDQHTLGNVLFPHNIGLSCSKNPQHFMNLGYWTKQGVKRSGFNYVFAPTVAVSHNPQWGRYYQSMGQNDTYIFQYAKAFIAGLQDVRNGKINGALGTAKHYFGDGATLAGVNEGSARVNSFESFLPHNTAGYQGAAQSQVGSVMASYSAVNNVPSSLNSAFLLGFLRDDLNFAGFVISDYDEVVRTQNELLPRTFMNLTQDKGYSVMVNAGIDMLMLSGSKSIVESLVGRVIKQAKKSVTRGYVKQQRLTQSVTRILQVKMAMGLVQSLGNQQPKEEIKIIPPPTSSGNQYQDSLNAVHQSLVLLKNSNTIPAKNLYLGIKYVVLVGQKVHNLNRLTKIQLFRNFDNIGMQSGGWSVRWQGFQGNDFWSGDNKKKSNASSILDALNYIKKINNFQLLYPNYTTFTNQVQIDVERRGFIQEIKKLKSQMNSKNTLIIGTFGEFPYAQSIGDVNNPYCKVADGPGCLYNPFVNPYAPGNPPKTLQLKLSKFQSDVISQVRLADKNIPLVSVILSGRPLLIDSIMQQSSAVIAAWLPGTSGGQGVVDAIAGDYIMRPNGQKDVVNTLSMDWPQNMDSLNDFPIYGIDKLIPKIRNPVFSAGYGLSSFTGTHNLNVQ